MIYQSIGLFMLVMVIEKGYERVVIDYIMFVG